MREKIIPLFQQSAIYSLSSLTGPLISIFMVPIYTRIFTPEDYGVINLVQVTIAFLAVLLILGNDHASGRFYLDTKVDQERKSVASTALILRTVTLVAGCIIFIYFSREISQLIFQTDAYSKYLIIAAAALPFVQCRALCQHMLRYNFRSVSYSIISVATLLVTVSLTILFVVQLRWGIMGIFWASLISAALFLAINFAITRNYFAFTFSTARLKEMLAYGIPMVPYGLTVYLIQNADRYFLSYFSSLEQVGLYSMGAHLSSLLLLVFTGTGLAWSPFVFSSYREEGSRAIYSRVMSYLIAITLFSVVGLSLFSREVLMIFTTPKFFNASTVVPFLALYLAFYHLGLRMGMGINISKKTFHFTWISAVTAGVNIGLNFLLVPPYGMIGAAVATLICSIVWCVLLVYISQQYYYVSYQWGAFCKILAVTLLILSSSYLLFSEVNWQNILIKIGLVGLFLVCLYIFRLIGKDELKYVKGLADRWILRK
jgi:O-antigen/teichoic acid export membrane protein